MERDEPRSNFGVHRSPQEVGPLPWDRDAEVWVPKDLLTSSGTLTQVTLHPSKGVSEGGELESNSAPAPALDPKATLPRLLSVPTGEHCGAPKAWHWGSTTAVSRPVPGLTDALPLRAQGLRRLWR